MGNPPPQAGYIIIGCYGHIIEIISRTSMRYLKWDDNPKKVGEVLPATNLYDFKYWEYGWRVDESSIVNLILKKYET